MPGAAWCESIRTEAFCRVSLLRRQYYKAGGTEMAGVRLHTEIGADLVADRVAQVGTVHPAVHARAGRAFIGAAVGQTGGVERIDRFLGRGLEPESAAVAVGSLFAVARQHHQQHGFAGAKTVGGLPERSQVLYAQGSENAGVELYRVLQVSGADADVCKHGLSL